MISSSNSLADEPAGGLIGAGLRVPCQIEREPGAGVDVSGVAYSNAVEEAIRGVVACGEACFGFGVAGKAERPFSGARAVAGYDYDA